MQTLGQVFDPKLNNLNIIRLFAAILVLFSHCYPLTRKSYEPIASYLGAYDTGGGWGVSIFFVISGFLVTRSVLNRSVGEYLLSRALRIVPALALVSLFEVLVIGPLFSNLTMARFFSAPEAYLHLKNVSVFWLNTTLPGVFANNPLPGVVNSSLWTLPIESAFYILLPVLLVFGFLRPERMFVPAALVAGWLAVGMIVLEWDWNHQGGYLFVGGQTYSVVKNGVFFLFGACLWIYRDRVPISHGFAVCCVLLLMIFAYQKARLVVMVLTLPYLVVYVAVTPLFRVRFYEKIGDLSYGAYLFAFPIQQALVAAFGGSIPPLALAALALPLTLGFAAFSWHSIERPALAFRQGRLAQPLKAVATSIE